MSGLGSFISAALGIAAAFYTGGASLWLMAASVAVSVLDSREDARRAKSRARGAYNDSLVDRMQMLDITPDSPRTLALGRVRTVEGIRRRWVSGTNSETLTMIVSFAGHEIDAFETFYFDDVPLTLDGSGYVTTDPYATGSLETATATTYANSSGSSALYISGSSDGYPASGTTPVATQRFDSAHEEKPLGVSGGGPSWTAYGADDTGTVIWTWQTGAQRYRARIRTYTGAAGQNVGAALAAEYPGKITSADKFEGMAVAVIDLDYDPDIFPQGIPNVTAVLRGAKVYDPREDSTNGGSGSHRLDTPSTWEWSENPALHAYHFARLATGWAVPDDEINVADVAAAAAVCDTSTTFTLRLPDTTTTTVTLPRYRSGIRIASDSEPRAGMEEIMRAMAGRWGWAGGVLRMRAGAMATPVFDMGPEWVAQRIDESGEPDGAPVLRITNGVTREQRVNRVTGTCVNPDERYQALPFPAVQDAVLIAADGAPYPAEIEFQAVNHPAHAQHLGSIAIRETQAALRMDAQCNLHAYRCELFDVGEITLPRFGMAAKTFEVLGWRWHPAEGVQLTLGEITADIFTPVAELRGADPAPNSSLRSPWDVDPITGLAVTSGTVALTDGSVLTRTRIEWTAVVQQSVRVGGAVEVQYTPATDTLPTGDWQSWEEQGGATAATIPGLLAGRVYIVRARAVQGLPRVRSAWSELVTHQVALAPDSGLYTLNPGAAAIVLAANGAGVVSSYAGATVTPKVFRSGTDDSTNWVITRTNGTGVSSTLAAGVLTVTALADATDNTYIDLTAIQGGYSDLVVRLPVSKARGGADGSPGATGPTGPAGSTGANGAAGADGTKTAVAYLFQWNTSTPGDPNSTSVYTWASAENSSYGGTNGWQTTQPANPGTPGAQLWVASKSIADSAAVTSTSVSWASGFSKVAWSANGATGAGGAAGASGVHTAQPTVYQWAVTIPAGPTGAATYTWATGGFGAAPSGWTLDPGTSPSAGYTLWGATVALLDAATATTTNFNWASASITARGMAGTNGSAGSPGSTGTAGASARYCYQRVAGNPAPTSGFITTAGSASFPPAAGAVGVGSNATWGINMSWEASDPNPSSTNTLYQADGIYDPATGNTVWATPYISSLKVGTLSAVTTNTGALTVTGDLTMSATSAIRAGAGTYATAGGWFAGYHSGAYKLSLGDKLTWDGSTLSINGGGTFTGALSAATGTFAGSLSAATGTFGDIGITGMMTAAGKPSYDTGTGAMLGMYAGNAYFGLTSTASGSLKGMWIGTHDGVLHVTGAVLVGATITTPTFDGFTASISGFGSSTVSSGSTATSSGTASSSGGASPVTYTWALMSTGATVTRGALTGSSSDVSLSVDNAMADVDVVLTATDANGRVSQATASLTLTVGTPP